MWTAIGCNLLATVVLTVHPLRRDPRCLIPACLVLFAAIRVEKGMGLFALTVLVRVALPVELGHARSPYLRAEAGSDDLTRRRRTIREAPRQRRSG